MTEAEYLLLCNLVYRDEFSGERSIDKTDKTVEEIIGDGVSNAPDQAMSSEEWD